MSLDQLFESLDLDKDGELSRAELHAAARRFGWGWREAPVYAVLDLFTSQGPLIRKDFLSHMTQILQDPLGPYGRVLLNAPRTTDLSEADNKEANPIVGARSDGAVSSVAKLLDDIAGVEAARDYDSLLRRLDDLRIPAKDAALLVIDPQRSFTSGAWMRSIGPDADLEVKPIRAAFDACARLLEEQYGRLETMFTRCPFPPESYDWDERLDRILDRSQPYFVKPDNSVMWPPTNGFREWAEDLVGRGKQMLVMGGCTLNSCLRISSIETQQHFRDSSFQVVVDLSLSGARRGNFVRFSLFGGLSSVEHAVREMEGSGVRVVRRVAWD